MMEQHQQNGRASQYVQPLNPHRRSPVLNRNASAGRYTWEYSTLVSTRAAVDGRFPFWMESGTQKTKMAKKRVTAGALQTIVAEL
jgi:hypothetical protein